MAASSLAQREAGAKEAASVSPLFFRWDGVKYLTKWHLVKDRRSPTWAAFCNRTAAPDPVYASEVWSSDSLLPAKEDCCKQCYFAATWLRIV